MWVWAKKVYWLRVCGQKKHTTGSVGVDKKKKKKKYTGYVGVDRKDLMLRGCGQRRSKAVWVWKKGILAMWVWTKKSLLTAWVWTKEVYWLCGRGQNGSTVCMGVDQNKSTEWART